MIVFSIISAVLLIAGVILLFGLTPEKITDYIMKVLSPKQTLRDRAMTVHGKKRIRRLTAGLLHIRHALAATGKGGSFALICALSLALMVVGCVLAFLLDNLFLLPVLSTALALIPFLYARNAILYYDRHIAEEMETALSVITTSYIRSKDIVSAVSENITYLKPPVRDILKSFVGDATAINSDIRASLTALRTKIDNDTFREWVDALIQCQDDRTLSDTLLPIVNKLTDIRVVNNELKTMLYEPKKEYYMMVFLLAGNIPLLYLLNGDWFQTLMFSLPGKITLAVCGAVILITAWLMNKYTKPVEYKR